MAEAPLLAEGQTQSPLGPRAKAVLIVFEGQAAFRHLLPGFDAFWAGDLFPMPDVSRTVERGRP